MPRRRKPKIAVWKFASCDGCQLSLLDAEDELLAVAGAVLKRSVPLTAMPLETASTVSTVTVSPAVTIRVGPGSCIVDPVAYPHE